MSQTGYKAVPVQSEWEHLIHNTQYIQKTQIVGLEMQSSSDELHRGGEQTLVQARAEEAASDGLDSRLKQNESHRGTG